MSLSQQTSMKSHSVRQFTLRFGLPVALFTLGVLALDSGSLFSEVVDGKLPADAPPPAEGTLGGPVVGLDAAELERWNRGRQLFDHDFHKSEGLGAPVINGDSCRGCHEQPVIGGAGALDLNVTRFARDNNGAGPFEDLAGGQGLSKFHPPFMEGREEHDPDVADVYEQRQTPPLFGLGEIDSILQSEILALRDPMDNDGDGISGEMRRVEVSPGVFELGRYGWKAQIPTIEDFVHDAMGAELGITTPGDGRVFALTSDSDGVADPELSNLDFADLVFYLKNLAAPERVGSQDMQVLNGELFFDQIGCAKCHVPSLMGTDGPVNAYTDLLVHQVMEPGFRGMSEPGAASGEYMTRPLWGIRLSAPYMHDGRAETLEDAILSHAGEALASRDAYENLMQVDREAVIAFLEDL